MDQFEGQQPEVEEKEQKQKGNFGWGVLGFFIPLVGLILFLVWKNDRPGDAKCAGIGALIGVIVSFVFGLIMGLVGFSMFSSLMGAITTL